MATKGVAETVTVDFIRIKTPGEWNPWKSPIREAQGVSLPAAEARDDVRTFMAWSPPSPGLDLFERASSLQERFSLSWWDAMIVASALEQGSDFLLSEDLQAGQNLDGMLVVNPFATLPAAVFP
jgi:hypothetical protein